MIRFRHGVSNFENLALICEGHSGVKGESLPCAAASALMAAACEALRRRNPKRLEIETEDGVCRIRCAYDQHTAEIAMTVICGFEWLSEQAPEDVSCERISSREQRKKKFFE